MVLNTNRLILRRFVLEDLSDYYEIVSNEEVNTYLPMFIPKDITEAKSILINNYINTDDFVYAICLKESNKMVGYITVSKIVPYDFGYALNKAYWNLGIITEASNEVIKYLKTSELPYITATHDKFNVASGRVLQKIGLSYKYSFIELWEPKKKYITFRFYQLNINSNIKTYDGYKLKYYNYIEKVI